MEVRNRYKKNKIKIYITVFVLNSIIITMFILLNQMSDKFINHNKHMVFAISNIKYIVTQSHLWLEEYLSGDKKEFSKIEIYINQSKEQLNILKNGGEIRGITFNQLDNSPKINTYLDETEIMLLKYENFIKKRLTEKMPLESTIDESFDKNFDLFIEHLEKFDSYINTRFTKMYTRYNNIKIFIFLFICILTLLAIFLIVKFSKELENSFRTINNQAIQLSKINENLEEEIRIRTEINIQDKEKLYQQEKLLSLNDLIKNIAHHWRQPLSYISTIASFTSLGTLKEKELKENMELIVNKTKELSNTIEYFRGAISDNHIVEATTLEELCMTLKNIIGIRLKEENISFNLKSNSSEHIFKLDKNSLISIILSIISNAKEIFNERGITNKKILIDIYIEDDSLILKVEDNAKGIDQDILNRIFEPYFTTYHQSTNKGLTLYLNQEEIRNKFNGQINAENGKDGAIFTIIIPIKIKSNRF